MKHKLLRILEGISYYYHDMIFFMKESNLDSNNRLEFSLCSSLTASYHIIEKGLSMPNRRLGFGQEKLSHLIEECNRFFETYGMNEQLSYAISIVKEYDNLHKSENFLLDNELQKKIDCLLLRFPNIQEARQLTYNRSEYFSKVNEPFDIFSSSRHSMRHFNGSIPIAELKNAIALAQNAPSACNKQPIRIHVISNKTTVKNILDLQQGNRGFGQTIDKVLIVTTQYTGCTRYSERYMPFIDAGIFTMNLLYSLHFYRIGAIPLVWLMSKERDDALREMTGIPQEEVPAIIIGIGNVSDTIVCAQSPRFHTESITKFN